MDHITNFMPVDQVRLNSERLETLYLKLGEDEADDVLCRAMEEMAIRLKQAQKLHGAGAVAELRKTVHSLIGIGDQIGMQTLARVAEDVTICVDRADWVALSATLARLVRCGDRSLTAIWDLQDITV